MKIMVVNTLVGLVPLGDDDYEGKKKLKIGQTYSADIKVARNIDFHCKYFALMSYAWELLNERETEAFKSKEGFRKSVQITAGYYNPIYNIKGEEISHEPMSISFGSMDETEFSELYERVKDVIFALVGDRIDEDQIKRLLIDF